MTKRKASLIYEDVRKADLVFLKIVRSAIWLAILICCKSSLAQIGSSGSMLPVGLNGIDAGFEVSNSGHYMLTHNLFNLSLSSEFVLEAKLSYATRAFKVQEVASDVGLGWESTLDNRIYRIVNGLPDNFEVNNFGAKIVDRYTHDKLFDYQTFTKIRNQELDSEPDVFVVKLNGKSSKFIIDENKEVVWLHEREYSVINNPFKRELGLSYWVIVDLLGNKFEFGKQPSDVEENSIVRKEKNITSHFYEREHAVRFVSSWMLSTLKPYDSNQITTFEYESVGAPEIVYYNIIDGKQTLYHTKTKLPIYVLGVKIKDFSSSVNVENVNHTIIQITKVINHTPRYLKRIFSPYGDVNISYSARKDVRNGRLLKSIEIRDKANTIAKKIKLNHFYTYSDEPNTLYTHVVPDLNPDKYRVMLDNVVEVFPSGDTLKQAEYLYNINNPLPPRYSSKIDHWGYHNKNQNGFDMSSSVYLFYSKSTDLASALSNSMHTVLYKTGSSTVFSYEPNSYYSDSLKYNQTAGGIRIREIRREDIEKKVSSRINFSYVNESGNSSGKIFSFKPLYEKFFTNPSSAVIMDNGIGRPSNLNAQQFINMMQSNVPSYGNFVYTQVPWDTNGVGSTVKPWQIDLAFTIGRLLFDRGQTATLGTPSVFTSFTNFNSNFQHTNVEYSQISASDGNGKIVREYTDIFEFPDYSFQCTINPSTGTVTSFLFPNEAPFTPLTSYAFARNKLKRVRHFDKNGKLLREQKYNYKKVPMNQKTLVGHVVANRDLSNLKDIAFGSRFYDYGRYTFIDSALVLNALEEKYYDANGKTTWKRSKLAYVENFPSLVKEVVVFNSEGDSTVTNSFYVANRLDTQIDPNNSLLLSSLLSNRSYGRLLKTTTVRNGHSKTKESIYQLFGSRILPVFDKIYTNSALNTVTDRISRYDDNGNVLEITKRNGTADSYLYAYNSTHKVAEILNTGYDVVTNSLGGRVAGLQLSWNQTEITSVLSALRQTLKTTKINTYIHKPFVGLLSKTDINGITESYEYDRFDRLELVKDHDGNIVTSLCYSYRWVPINCADGKRIFANRRRSQEFANSTCLTGQIPQKAVYVVPEGKYISTVSQADADAQAQAEINQRGQAYVNSVTSCDFVMLDVPLVRYTGWNGEIGRIQFFNGNQLVFAVFPKNTGEPWEDEILKIPAGAYSRVTFDVNTQNTPYIGYLSFINANPTRSHILDKPFLFFELKDVHVDKTKDNRIIIAEYMM